MTENKQQDLDNALLTIVADFKVGEVGWKQTLKEIKQAVAYHSESPSGADSSVLVNKMEDICANCGGRYGIHNHMNQRCPMNIDASPDHTSYRDTVFVLLTPEQILIDALQTIDLYDDVADPPFTPKQFGDIARKALKEYQSALNQKEGK